MNKANRHIVAFAICLALAGWCRAESVTLTYRNGQTVEGEFVRRLSSSVTLKRANGMTVNVPFSQLTDDSREQAQQLGGGGTAKPGASGGTAGRALSPAGAKATGIPTDAEIAAFMTEFPEKTDETIIFTAHIGLPSNLKPDVIRSYQRKGKVPYRVTMELQRKKMVDGKARFARLDGNGYFVLLNEAGDVVDRKREALAKLCPS